MAENSKEVSEKVLKAKSETLEEPNKKEAKSTAEKGKTGKKVKSQKDASGAKQKKSSNNEVNYNNYAIVQKGHAQFVLHEGELLEIPRINVEEGKEYVFEEVLAVFKDGESKIGTPFVENAKVKVFVIKQLKGKKEHGFKYKAKSRYRRRWGYRKPKTRIRVISIEV